MHKPIKELKKAFSGNVFTSINPIYGFHTSMTDTTNLQDTSNRHPHYDVIVAWAEGKKIQLLNTQDCWVDLDMLMAPTFIASLKYRIKPDPVMIRHFRAPGNSVILIAAKNYSASEDRYLNDVEGSAIWLDDWHEASFGPYSAE